MPCEVGHGNFIAVVAQPLDEDPLEGAIRLHATCIEHRRAAPKTAKPTGRNGRELTLLQCLGAYTLDLHGG